jgi:hypothetical protein
LDFFKDLTLLYPPSSVLLLLFLLLLLLLRPNTVKINSVEA